MPELRKAYVTIMVENLDRAIEFYAGYQENEVNISAFFKTLTERIII